MRNDLHCVEYVPMYNDRTIIPVSMRKQVLEVLHSAHQGVYSIGLRAEDSVCYTCNTTAPKQSNLPPVEPVVPEYPFQHVRIDYLTIGGVSYRLFVDWMAWGNIRYTRK